MIYYDRIDVPEEIGDNKAANQKSVIFAIIGNF